MQLVVVPLLVQPSFCLSLSVFLTTSDFGVQCLKGTSIELDEQLELATFSESVFEKKFETLQCKQLLTQIHPTLKLHPYLKTKYLIKGLKLEQYAIRTAQWSSICRDVSFWHDIGFK